MILLSNNSWEIKVTEKKGRGIFAKKNITKGTVIGDYIGTVLKPWEVDVNENNFYLMYYHDKAVIAPDEHVPGVHFLNHSCNPNSWLYIYKGHTLAFALRNIQAGEEITISYLLAPGENCKNCQHICICNDEKCIKTMHTRKSQFDKWRKITEVQSKETKRERIHYGKLLPVLSMYPKKIPEDYIKKITSLLTT